MKMSLSPTHLHVSARNVRAYTMKAVSDSAIRELSLIGINISPNVVRKQVNGLLDANGAFVGDSAFTAPATTASIPTPLQFLQTWLPGFVKVMTAARKIDDLIGINTVGSWEDEEIVQGIVEPGATPTEYGDYVNVPMADWNTNFERRSVVRGFMGMGVGVLEEARSAKMRLSSADTKRQGAAVSLEIMRNAIGFYGWNNGNNRTYGFLNDPALPAFITSSVDGGWSKGSFQQITGDIRASVVRLRTQSQDQIDPEKIDLTLALPTNRVDYLSVTTDYGISVRDWLTSTYPKMRIVSAPELGDVAATNPADGAVFYLYAESISSEIDGSSDDGEVFSQLVQSKFMTLGVEKKVTAYIEGYSNASAGALCKRPWAVVRVMGI